MNLSKNQKILLVVIILVGLYLYFNNKNEHAENVNTSNDQTINQTNNLLNYVKDANSSGDIMLLDPKNNVIFTIYQTPTCHHILLLNNIKLTSSLSVCS